MRRPLALAVVVLHGLLLWLLAMGFRHRPDPETPLPQMISLWIPPPETVTPVEPPPTPERAGIREAQPQRQSTAEPSPAADPVTLPLVPVPESQAAPPAVATPPVDWAQQAALAARRTADAQGTPKAEPFSGKPQGIKPRCVPKERSMEWNGGENPGVHWHGPFPVLVTKRCAITVGFFACVIGELPPPDGTLLDDMKDPDRSRSSVPDPNICD